MKVKHGIQKDDFYDKFNIKKYSFVTTEIMEDYENRPSLNTCYKEYLNFLKKKKNLANYKQWLFIYTPFSLKPKEMRNYLHKLRRRIPLELNGKRNFVFQNLKNSMKYFEIVEIAESLVLKAIHYTRWEFIAFLILSKRSDMHSRDSLKNLCSFVPEQPKNFYECSEKDFIKHLILGITKYKDFIVRGVGFFDDPESSIEIIFHKKLSYIFKED